MLITNISHQVSNNEVRISSRVKPSDSFFYFCLSLMSVREYLPNMVITGTQLCLPLSPNNMSFKDFDWKQQPIRRQLA